MKKIENWKNKMINKIKNLKDSKLKIAKYLFGLFVIFSMVFPAFSIQAQTNNDPNTLDVNSSSFKLLVCDGPPLPSNVPKPKANYVPCDFQGLMSQVQHLINIAIVLGVIVAIVLMTYAGFLYIKGGKGIDEAKAIFPKIFWGFIIMLSAWFIVYQILSWLTGNDAFKVLLGTP